VHLVPFLLGEADVEAAGPGWGLGSGTSHRIIV
jgi:hypothetical protein